MIEYLPIVLTGLGLTASILYYTSVLRNANKTREAQLFMQIYDKWSDPDMLSSFEIVSATELSSIEDFLETRKNQ